MSKYSPPLPDQTHPLKSALETMSRYLIAAIDRLRRNPYNAAVVSVGLALLLMLALDPIAGMTQSPFLLFFGTVVISAWQGGIRSGLVATGLAALISNYFFLEPKYTFAFAVSDGIRLAVFILECILISVLCGSLRKTNQRLDRNIKKLEASEESLQIANQHITDILESITDGFYTLDHQWRFTHINRQAEQTIGRSRDELLGHPIWNFFPEARETWLEQNMHRAINERSPVVFEAPSRLRPGRWFEVHINPLHDGLAVYFQDVTERKQAEDELRLSENRYRTLANAVPQMMWVNAADGRVEFFNQQWVNYTGMPLEQNLQRWIQVIHPEDIQFVIEARSRAFEANAAYEMEVRLRRFDGSYRWHLARILPLKDEAGQVLNWFGTATDIHTVKQVEEALRQSEERFRLATLAVGGVVYDWDVPTGTVVRSEGLYCLLGIHPNNAPTRQDWWSERIHPEDFAQIQSLMATIFQGSSDRYDLEYRIRHQDGYWVDVWDRGYLIRNAENQLVRIIGSTTDITKRKQIEETLKQSEERLRFAIEGAELGTWDYDLASQQILLSEQAKKIAGLVLETNVDYDVFLNIVYPEDRERIRAAVDRAITQYEDYDVEMRFVHIDGVTRWVRSIGRAYYSADGIPTRMAGVVLDITDRKQVEQEKERLLERERSARENAEQANRVKDEFLAVLSHELRSPLNPILGWTRLLQSGRLDETRQAEALATIERNAKLQTQLIEDLLDISRIMRGKLTLTATLVSLTFVISAAVETVRLAAEAKQIEIQLDLSTGVAPVFGDAARLQQVVWNLLTNAVKFTPKGGQIKVRLEQVIGSSTSVIGEVPQHSPITHAPLPDTHYAQITVTDNGKGISPDFLPHVFEYFRQADASTTRQFGGLGLGLAIVQQIMEMHGGMVRAESLGENQGATFTVQLPISQQAISTVLEAIPAEAENQENPLSKLQILVVDDDDDARKFQAFLLEQQGARVTTVASGLEALQVLDQFIPDVIVSDIGMAVMDGYMLMQQIRSRAPHQSGKVPAIALTAYARDFDQQQAIQAGFQAHITKPVEPEVLVKAIVRILKQAT